MSDKVSTFKKIRYRYRRSYRIQDNTESNFIKQEFLYFLPWSGDEDTTADVDVSAPDAKIYAAAPDLNANSDTDTDADVDVDADAGADVNVDADANSA